MFKIILAYAEFGQWLPAVFDKHFTLPLVLNMPLSIDFYLFIQFVLNTRNNSIKDLYMPRSGGPCLQIRLCDR